MNIISVAFKYLRRYPGFTIAALSSIIMASFFEGASFGMLIPLIQSFTMQTGTILEKVPIIKGMKIPFSSMNQKDMLSLILVLLFLTVLIKNIFTYLSNVLTARLRFGLIRDLGTGLMDRMIEYDIKFFDNMKTGHLVTSLNVETNRIGNWMLSLLRFAATLGKVTAYVVLLCLISLKVSALLLILVALILLPLEFIMKKLKKLGGRISEAASDYNYKLLETLNGIRIIRSSATEELEKQRFKAISQKVYRYNYKSNEYIYLLMPVSEVVMFSLIAAGIMVLLRIAKIDTADTFPFIATYLVVMIRALTQLNLLNTLRSEAVNNLAAVANYESLYDKNGKTTVRDGADIIERFSDAIELRNVSFSYVPGKQVLNNVHMVIPQGKITAFVGMSGAGKSTIVNLILRFYNVNSGQILIDGRDLKNLSLKEWRRKIGVVSQDIFLFNTTVKENVSYGREGVKEENVVAACKEAFAHDFIIKLPQKYDTILGERGTKLSGGQKQRLSIARAIIHNPEILILDEATSSLDTNTEMLINEAIDRLTSDRTVIAIAHRLSTILHADNIIVLHEGLVAETGSHADLIRKSGLYKRLYDAQFNAQAIRHVTRGNLG
jgi:ATP-binding cassette, subfamily B, bacterial MsbA